MNRTSKRKVKITDISVSIYTEGDELIESYSLPNSEKQKRAMIRAIENEVLDFNYRLERADKMRAKERAEKHSWNRKVVIESLARQGDKYGQEI